MAINLHAPLIYQELLDLSEQELIERHDQLLQKDNINIGLDYYVEALRYKGQDKQTQQMLSYTRWIVLFTVIVTLATIINVFIAYKLLPK